MDILAHGLWAGLGVAWVKRRQPVTRRTAVLTMALAMLPDVVHLLPVAAWAAFAGGNLEALLAYALATPGREPRMPAWVALGSHHLHCVMHSALVAGACTVLLWRWRTQVGLILSGWWLHIVIDIFTHSADYYPAPVLYPITQRGFDGLAWNTPWFLVATYLALALCAWLLLRRHPPVTGRGGVERE